MKIHENLKILSVNGNCLKSVDYLIDFLPKLQNFRINKNEIDQIELRKQTNLIEFEANSNQIQNISFLNYFPRLQKLDLRQGMTIDCSL